MTQIKLSVLDQSVIRTGSTVRDTMLETMALAQLADQLGYSRFWVSEHHNIATIAGSTPEVLLAFLSAHTQHIRLGSAGVMLPNHSSLKVAENFRMLEALAPGRIDLGVGRAPGGDRLTSRILNPQNTFSDKDFVQQIMDLQHFLTDNAPEGTLYEKVKAMPQTETAPPIWLLTSSGGSAGVASHFGTALSFAHFINPSGGPEVVHQYRKEFKPSATLAAPLANFGIFAFTSESPEIVERWQTIMDYRLMQIERGRDTALPSYEAIREIEYMPDEQLRVNYNRRRMVCGSPEEVKAKITAMCETYEVDEAVISTIAENQDERMESFRLLAKVFGLQARN